MPRKNTFSLSSFLTRARGFNEAAARCRGKTTYARRGRYSRILCFNEAAARCRGKTVSQLADDREPASMLQ